MSDNDHDARVRRQFGASAGHYRTSTTHAQGPSLSRLLELVRPGRSWRVLDAATGAGHTAARIAPSVSLVVAGDMTREMLDQATLVCREAGVPNVVFVRESALALAYRDASFDLVTCRVAAHHFMDPGRFVAECARVLKPGGKLAIIDNIVPDDDDAAQWMNDFERQRDPSHARCLSLSAWRALLSRCGLRLAHSEVNAKWFDFDEWMGRMNVAPATLTRLREALLDAPQSVREFWQPVSRKGRVSLALQEAILLGEKGR